MGTNTILKNTAFSDLQKMRRGETPCGVDTATLRAGRARYGKGYKQQNGYKSKHNRWWHYCYYQR